MTGALILLGLLIVTGLILWLTHRPETPDGDKPAQTTDTGAPTTPAEGECCGLHTICEKYPTRIIYYDDEELDRFKGRGADDYTDAETEEFRHVMLTLLSEDVAGWNHSLQLRGIELPATLRDEMMLLLSETTNA